jgi:hypothetical protein
MKFNIGTTEIASQSNGATRLKAGEIHLVKYDGAEATVIEKKDGSATFDVLKLKFKNDDGTFEHVIFEPKEGDEVRVENAFGSQNPSNLENLIFTVKHLLAAVAPEVSKKIEEKGLNIEGWNGKNGLREFVVNNTAKSIGKEVEIKLVKDKTGNAVFPSFPLGMSKEGNVYPRTNFIGKNLQFTAKEIERMNSITSAAPTQMSSGSSAKPAEDDDLIF